MEFVGWGGERLGAGRKRSSLRKNVPHVARESRTKTIVAHVTFRLAGGLPNLRSKVHFDVIMEAVREIASGLWCRIVEFSVLRNHLHLLVEAANMRELSSSMRSLEIRIAKRLNKHLGRSGPVFGDRYHVHEIETPREARNAIGYVLLNARKHAKEEGIDLPDDWIDPRSSAPWFEGWSNRSHIRPCTLKRPVPAPRSWLLAVGWRMHGLIATNERIASGRATSAESRGGATADSTEVAAHPDPVPTVPAAS